MGEFTLTPQILNQSTMLMVFNITDIVDEESKLDASRIESVISSNVSACFYSLT